MPTPRAARDLVEARLRPDFGERRLGRLEQPVAVALGVGAGLAGRRAGAFPPAARRERLVTSALKFRVSLAKRREPPYIDRRHPPFIPASPPLAILSRGAEAADLRLLNLETIMAENLWRDIHHRRGAGRRQSERQARAGDRRIGRPRRGDGPDAGGAWRRSGRRGARFGQGESGHRSRCAPTPPTAAGSSWSQLDLASLASVRACADALVANGKPFDS